MAAGNYDLYMEQGATFSLVITWKDSSNTPINLTSYTARMQVRRTKQSTTVIVEASTTDGRIVLGGALGTITVTIPATVTDDLDFGCGVYDLEVESSGGQVTRLIEGGVSFSKEVTR
jgi:hypothetical protein